MALESLRVELPFTGHALDQCCWLSRLLHIHLFLTSWTTKVSVCKLVMEARLYWCIFVLIEVSIVCSCFDIVIFKVLQVGIFVVILDCRCFLLNNLYLFVNRLLILLLFLNRSSDLFLSTIMMSLLVIILSYFIALRIQRRSRWWLTLTVIKIAPLITCATLSHINRLVLNVA